MVERQGWGEITEGSGAPLIRVLLSRGAQPTLVKMADGAEFALSGDWAWGRNFDDLWEHVVATTDSGDVMFFYMSDVEALLDPDSRTILASQAPSPGET